MPDTTDLSAPFKLSAGHAALDLVNTLDNRFRADGPVELLGDYARLLAFTVQAGVLEPRGARRLTHAAPAATLRALHAARELREALAAALYGRLDEKPVRPQELVGQIARLAARANQQATAPVVHPRAWRQRPSA